MEITYNGVAAIDATNMITFSDVPNILKVKENISGSYAQLTISVNITDWNTQVLSDGQFYFTFLSETITNVMTPSKAKNKRFYISSSPSSTAMSIAAALRNCPTVAVDYYVVHNNSTVIVTSKTIGRKFTQSTSSYISTNFPISYNITDGDVNSDFHNSKVILDVFTSSTNDNGAYIGTLEKNYWGSECSFDVSSVLAAHSDYGKLQPYSFNVSYTKENGNWTNLGYISGQTTNGYMANQSEKFLYNTYVRLLMNKERSMQGNGMKLYVYDNLIPFTTLVGQGVGGWTTRITCRNSAYQIVYDETTTQQESGGRFHDREIIIPQSAFTESYYIDITEGTDTVRFNVIKPLKAADTFQRVMWRNEYGGISFFDFTGQRTESDSVDIETYEKNIFDYYENDEFERKRIYKNDYKKEVKLTSHLMEEDGKWIFNSLMRSKRVWTQVNGKTYYIIPKSIEVTENDQYDNIYTAKLTYTYSDL